MVFQGFKPGEIERVTSCLGVQVKTFAPKEAIAHAGERSTSIGVVIDGSVLARNIDADGDTLLLDVNGRGKSSVLIFYGRREISRTIQSVHLIIARC